MYVSRAQDDARDGGSIAAGDAFDKRTCGGRSAREVQRGNALIGAVDPDWGIMNTKSKARDRLTSAVGLIGALFSLALPALWTSELAWLPTILFLSVLAWQRAASSALVVHDCKGRDHVKPLDEILNTQLRLQLFLHADLRCSNLFLAPSY